MPVQILKMLRNRASQMTYNSMLYNWSLRGEVPERMVVRPVDAWPGDAENGRWLCNGAFCIDGGQLAIGPEGWEPQGVSQTWLEHMHGFTWLRDLRSLSCEKGQTTSARAQARGMIESWMSYYPRWHELAWRPDIAGERLSMWLSSYEFFGQGAFETSEDEEIFQDEFFDSVVRQARHLSRCLAHGLPETCHGVRRFKAIKGLLYVGLAFEGRECWIEQALGVLEREMDAQIAGDGSHRSRSPSQLLEVLQILLDIRMALSTGDYPLPEKIQHAIDRMGPALRFFRYNDKYLALFNGAQEGDKDHIDSVLGQASVRGKAMQSLPSAGFERASLGRTTLMVDCGKSPDYPYDASAHAGPLSFEMSYGRERLFVNCGSHPYDETWQESLRSTAAHNSLTLDSRNACEIKEGGHFARKTREASCVREDTKNAVFIEASHDGYVPLNGFTHTRRLYLSDQGHDLRGEDVLESPIVPARPVDVALRFHLHPRVMVSLIRDGQEALLRMPGGVGWRFHHQSGYLVLEDSIYMGQGGQPRKTKQLAIYGQLTDKEAKIKWALQKEG